MTGPPSRHVPERTCVGCRATRPKRELIRLMLPIEPADALASVDPTGRGHGRGAYLCADHPTDCLALTRRRRSLPRALRTGAERVDIDALASALAATTGVAGIPHNQEVLSSPR